MMTAIMKLLFDLCFYYTLSGYFLYLAAEEYPAVWGIPLILAANAIPLVLKKFPRDSGGQARLRLPAAAACALPAVLLLLGPTWWQILQYLPAWAYSCFVVWSGRTDVTYREFEDHFTFTGKLHLLLIFGVIFVTRIPGALTGATPYFALYILSGVFLMRILREEGKLSAGRSAAVLLGLLFSAVAITVFRAPQLFLTAAGFLYRNVIVWVFTGLAVIVAAVGYAICYLFIAFISLFSEKTEQIKPGDPGLIAQEILGEELTASQGDFPVWLKAVLLALLAAAIIFIIYLIFRRLLGGKSSAGRVSAYVVAQERLERAQGKTGGVFRPKDPRLAVRWYYRKYLKEGISRGAQLAPSDTSKSVRLKYERFFAGNTSSADSLREVYIKARYAERYPVQSRDAAEAHALWKNLKEQKQG